MAYHEIKLTYVKTLLDLFCWSNFVPVYAAGTIYVSDADRRITNGIPAIRGQFPWQAGILIDSSSFCGGSLISDRWILTAAHCTWVYQKHLLREVQSEFVVQWSVTYWPTSAPCLNKWTALSAWLGVTGKAMSLWVRAMTLVACCVLSRTWEFLETRCLYWPLFVGFVSA
jgi:hypothetical protein